MVEHAIEVPPRVKPLTLQQAKARHTEAKRSWSQAAEALANAPLDRSYEENEALWTACEVTGYREREYAELVSYLQG
jgi:hypothetical protein